MINITRMKLSNKTNIVTYLVHPCRNVTWGKACSYNSDNWKTNNQYILTHLTIWATILRPTGLFWLSLQWFGHIYGSPYKAIKSNHKQYFSILLDNCRQGKIGSVCFIRNFFFHPSITFEIFSFIFQNKMTISGWVWTPWTTSSIRTCQGISWLVTVIV